MKFIFATGRPLVEKMTDLQPLQECIVIGTIYIENPSKPNILDEVALEYHLKKNASSPTEREKRFPIEKSIFYLEDEYGRCCLDLSEGVKQSLYQGNKHWVTGMIVAIYGYEREDDGNFHVLDYCFSGLPCQPQPPALPEEDFIVAFISGLTYTCNDANGKIALEMDLIKSLVCGDLIPSVHADSIVFCGSTLKEPESYIDEDKKTKFGVVNYRLDTRHFGMFDSCVYEILQSGAHVLVIPGENDPTNASLPQQPLHVGLFPKCTGNESLKESFHLSTNPSMFSFGQLK